MWSSFTNVTVNGWQIFSLIKTVIPKPEVLANSIWKLKFSAGDAPTLMDGEGATIKFTKVNKFNYTEDKASNVTSEQTYSINGAGMYI